MSKVLNETQLGFFLSINNARLDDENGHDVEHVVHAAALARFSELVKTLPCWSEPSAHHDDNFDIHPYEVCEGDFEVDEKDGLSLFSIWVRAGREFPVEHIEMFRGALVQALTEAAAAQNVPARHVRSEMYRQWTVSERVTLG